MTFYEKVLHGIEFGTSLGAEYTELRYVQTVMESYRIRNGDIISAGSTESEGIGIRTLMEGGMAFVSTASLAKGEIEQAVQTAVRLARSTRRRSPLVLSKEQIVQTNWEVPVEIPFPEITSDTKLQRLLEVERELTSVFDSGALPIRSAMIVTETSKKFLATSEGTQIESDYSLGRFTGMITAKGAKGSEQRFFSRGATAGWEWFAAPQFIETFIDEAKAVHRVAELAEQVTFEKPVDVIIGPEVAGIIAHENCGHPSEADRIQGREGANAGESFWMDIDIGKTRVGSPAVTIIDNPTIPKSGGYYLYDDEGVKARPRYLIKEGIANEIFHDRQTAGRIGVLSNGSSRATGFDREPIPRMANTYFAAGDYSVEELVEEIKFGVFIDNFTEWNIDDRRYQSKYTGSLARIIRNGEVTDEYVRRPVLELTSRGLFESVDACAKGFVADQAICGKSDPGQGIAVWTAGPEAVRMRKIRLGGVQQ